ALPGAVCAPGCARRMRSDRARARWRPRRCCVWAGRGRRPARTRRRQRARGARRRSQREAGLSAAAGTWLFDLGNSRLKFAPLRDGDVGDIVAIEHDGDSLAHGWEERLPRELETACVAAVAGRGLAARLAAALAARGAQVSTARTLASLDGVRIAYAQPERLGVDRFLALLGAHAHVAGASLVVGVGTALTVDLLDAAGVHRGGRIAPSPDLMRAALHARAPVLAERGGV